jgi:hypothetical protein
MPQWAYPAGGSIPDTEAASDAPGRVFHDVEPERTRLLFCCVFCDEPLYASAENAPVADNSADHAVTAS